MNQPGPPIDRRREIAADIFQLLQARKATNLEGIWALTSALAVTLIDTKVPKGKALLYFAKVWDDVAVSLKITEE